MDFKKLAPWNWFKDEENERNSQSAVSCKTQSKTAEMFPDSISPFHNNIHELFGRYLQGYGTIPHTLPGTGMLNLKK